MKQNKQSNQSENPHKFFSKTTDLLFTHYVKVPYTFKVSWILGKNLTLKKPIGPTLHYRGASTLQPPRTFRSNSSNSTSNVAKHSSQMKLFDHNHNIYGTNKRKSHHYNSTANHHYNMLDDICEFQVKIDFSAMPIKAPASKVNAGAYLGF